MQLSAAESTELFVGNAEDPLQVVRVRYTGEPGPLVVEGDGLRSVGEPRPSFDGVLEVPVRVDNPTPGRRRAARVVAGGAVLDFEFEDAEPGALASSH